jgi:hypothetical protein
MYYEKLNQGCIAGWRIRANHLWRFENGGFQGRGMKQEEAIAQQHKENEALVTAAHKAAAAEALAAGHPNVKTSMSMPGVSDGAPAPKRQRTKSSMAPRRKSVKTETQGELSMSSDTNGDMSFYTNPGDHGGVYDHIGSEQQGGDPSQSGSSNSLPIDPSLMGGQHHPDDADISINMVQQAMQAAAAAGAGQMDELEMGMQIPIEMQMHGGDNDGDDDGHGYGGYQGGHHPYSTHQGHYEGGQWYQPSGQ